jgi:AraC family chitin signaling transcriptional activator
MIRSHHLIPCLFIIFQFSFSQELPPVTSFYPETYNAGDQNWDVTQDEGKRIYFANNKGLLEFNGQSWRLYPTPNQSIIRSVLAVKEKIFSGQYRDFGYWTRNEMGTLEYTSLMQQLKLVALEDEEFWGIEVIGDWLMFQSLDRIYIINESTGRVNIIESETTLTEMILVDETIVFQKSNLGVFKIDGGEPKLISSDPQIVDQVLIDVFIKGDVWYFVTQTNGIFEMNEGQVSKSSNEINNTLDNRSIYSAQQLSNGMYALGTISNGLFLFNESDELTYHLNQSNGLSNNTVLSVFEDVDGNIWLAMDNGISLINQNSKYKVFYDEEGLLGTVYTSALYNGTLYLGTNQGLFYKDELEGFSLVAGLEGQVWSLDLIDDQLFCGHDRGTFIITNTNQTSKIADQEGTWKVKTVEDRPDLLIQGNYNGLYILENLDGSWKLRNKLNGFDTSARYFEFTSTDEIVVSHEYKGIFKLKVTEDFDEIEEILKLDVKPSVHSSVVSFKGAVYYAGKYGVFKYDAQRKEFEEDSVAARLASYSPYVSGKLMVTDDGDRLWYASSDGLSYLSPDDLSGDFTVDFIPLSLDARATKSGYENLMKLSSEEYLLGTTEGYILLNVSEISTIAPWIQIEKVLNTSFSGEERAINFEQQQAFDNECNSFQISFYAPLYNVLERPSFRYRLKGLYDDWSEWSPTTDVSYDNLPSGSYEFNVQVKSGNLISEIPAVYQFEVAKPWYLSTQALLLYVVGLIILGFSTHSVYRGYYKAQRNKLLKEKEKEIEFKEMEAKQEIMRFKNENLKMDVESKSRELGLSTMNLIQRNELLNDIKKQLSEVNSVKEIKKVIQLINRQLNTSAEWKVFEEAFNNADKDFIKNLKSIHPNLTSNDLRLCSYLRLNLSSKEIAPLLNISHKSVEVKRYRLRKKMGLDHNVNLTDYILQV